MGLGVTPVAPGLLYRETSNLYCPLPYIVIDLPSSRLVFQANIHQIQFQSAFELIHNVVHCQKLLTS